METSETRYVAVRDADVAYQVVGEGLLDLLYFLSRSHMSAGCQTTCTIKVMRI
jgi:hypothetical protein